ncbi:hypothetical protein PVAP13_8NG199801 [Panicum virgatum]|uniref:Uncharacterized protein n=1 Tax=Panicum virgatum TaxID=38727 RepID=A0A8T0PBC5_PANVG|nr:hypothetical protein PVAP13_8NG199801 [Panicum virgatum]
MAVSSGADIRRYGLVVVRSTSWIPPLKWHWWLVDWILDVLHRLSSVGFDFELLQSPVEWRSLKYIVFRWWHCSRISDMLPF